MKEMDNLKNSGRLELQTIVGLQEAKIESIDIRLKKFKKQSEVLTKENQDLKLQLQQKVKECNENSTTIKELEKKLAFTEREEIQRKKEAHDWRLKADQRERELFQAKEMLELEQRDIEFRS